MEDTFELNAYNFLEYIAVSQMCKSLKWNKQNKNVLTKEPTELLHLLYTCTIINYYKKHTYILILGVTFHRILFLFFPLLGFFIFV